MENNRVIAIDGTSASGKSTTSRALAKRLDYVYVDTGAMYRTLAWFCVKSGVDIHSEKAVSSACRKWKTRLACLDKQVQLLVDGYYPDKEIRTEETSAAVPHVAAVPKVRDWMKKTQRDCLKFGDLVMEGRDIGSNVFPETDYKFYLDASLSVRSQRRTAEGVNEDLAARDQRDSQRKAAPLMVPLGAIPIDNSDKTIDQVCDLIISETERIDGIIEA
ncbi:MAG: (d)CMP kinase [Limisphaerales bacterium]